MPVEIKLTAVVAEAGEEITPLPDTNVQSPVPTDGAFPAKVAEVTQTVCDTPAFEIVGGVSRTIATVEVDGAQTLLLIDHWNTFTPNPKPVTPLFGDVGDVIVPAPDTNVHEPVPTAGVFPFKVALVAHSV